MAEVDRISLNANRDVLASLLANGRLSGVFTLQKSIAPLSNHTLTVR
jgi:hypothetical protein